MIDRTLKLGVWYTGKVLARVVTPHLPSLSPLARKVRDHQGRLRALEKHFAKIEGDISVFNERAEDLISRCEEIVIIGTTETGEYLDLPDSGG